MALSLKNWALLADGFINEGESKMIKLTARKALADALAISKSVPAQLRNRIAEFKEAAGADHCELVKQTLGELEYHLNAPHINWPAVQWFIQELADRMPSYTYGEIPAGTSFRFPDQVIKLTYVKRKEGVEVLGRDELIPHFPGDQIVNPVNW